MLAQFPWLGPKWWRVTAIGRITPPLRPACKANSNRIYSHTTMHESHKELLGSIAFIALLALLVFAMLGL